MDPIQEIENENQFAENRRNEIENEEAPETVMVAFDLRYALEATRKEPGLPLDGIASVIRQVFDNDEISQLINRLSKYL